MKIEIEKEDFMALVDALASIKDHPSEFAEIEDGLTMACRMREKAEKALAKNAQIDMGEEEKPLYNHMIDVAFSVEGPWADFSDIPKNELLKGMQKRLDYIRDNPDEASEAFGLCDTYEVNPPIGEERLYEA